MTPGPLLADAPRDEVSEVARRRLIARHEGTRPGPTSVFIAGMHGNESMAAEALRRVCSALPDLGPSFRGRAFALIGNVQACAANRRFIDRDLNRAFTYELRLSGLRLVPPLELSDAEHAELRDLLAAMRRIIESADAAHEVNVVDLHTFSGDGAPFCVFSDTMRNRSLARCWPVPNILGLAEQLPGTLTDYLTAAGCISAVIETGRHDDPASADLHESAIRLALVQAGHVPPTAWPDLADDRRRLADAAAAIPAVLDVQVRHGIEPQDAFRMRPGFANFTPVVAGQHVADDVRGSVRAERGGRILLPLYQDLGNDGYFIARPVGRFWLTLSALLRRARISDFAHVLPGVQRHPDLSDALVVDRRIARWLASDVLHLLGYRRVYGDPDVSIFRRRPHDFTRPHSIEIGAPPDDGE